jgi:hypothetical protein
MNKNIMAIFAWFDYQQDPGRAGHRARSAAEKLVRTRTRRSKSTQVAGGLLFCQ